MKSRDGRTCRPIKQEIAGRKKRATGVKSQKDQSTNFLAVWWFQEALIRPPNLLRCSLSFPLKLHKIARYQGTNSKTNKKHSRLEATRMGASPHFAARRSLQAALPLRPLLVKRLLHGNGQLVLEGWGLLRGGGIQRTDPSPCGFLFNPAGQCSTQLVLPLAQRYGFVSKFGGGLGFVGDCLGGGD